MAANAIASCSPAATPTAASLTLTTVPVTATVPATAEPEPYPQTHTDALHRSVTISAKPVRIVSRAPSVTEIRFAISAGPQVAGRSWPHLQQTAFIAPIGIVALWRNAAD